MQGVESPSEHETFSDRARDRYLYARAVVGREFAKPAVVARAPG